MKTHRHHKLTEAMLMRLREQATLHAQIAPYKQLAAESGLTYETIKQLMAELIREARVKRPVVRRGTYRGELFDARCAEGLRA